MTDSQRQDGFKILKRCFNDTGYVGLVEKTSSYATFTNHSKCDVRNQVEGVTHQILQLLFDDYAENVWKEIITKN